MAQLFEEFLARYTPENGRGAPPGSGIAGPSGQARAAVEAIVSGRTVAGQPGAADLEGQARAWYTGRNLEGTGNGWDTDFMRAAQSGYDEALRQDRVLDYFTSEDATGVVTWDGAAGRDGESLGFGDVVVQGRKVGNVYEDFDRHTANVMMGEWTIQDGVAKARLNRAGSPERVAEAWDVAVEEIRKQNTEQAELAPRAREYREGIEGRAEEENVLGLVAAGAAGGALTGTGLGAALTAWLGPGALVGAGIGGGIGTLVGGISTWLNQDALAYQVARERETLDVIRQQSPAAYAPQLAQSVASVATSVGMSPFSNLVQGVYDVSRSDGPVFDASTGGEFQATNREGERETGAPWQVGEFVSKIGDSLVQFASPAARAAYTAQMALQIGGKAAGLAPGVGQWDPSRVEVDSVWTDREGKFDPVSAAAGIGAVGIDAVQLGGVRGVFRSADRQAQTAMDARVAGGEVLEELRPARLWGQRLTQAPERAARWFERRNLSREQREALEQGGRLDTQSGLKFVTDAEGRVVGEARATLAMLAPSEALQSFSAKMLARRDAAAAKGAVDAEQLYRTAYSLASGERQVQQMLVNAFGEAQEEGLQQVLEPLSHEAALQPEEIFRAAAGGFASGLGMGGALALTRPSGDDRLFALASLAQLQSTGTPLTTAEWEAMNPTQRRVAASRLGELGEAQAREGLRKLEAQRTNEVALRAVGAAHVQDVRMSLQAAALQAATPATDASHMIVQMDEKTNRPDAGVTSHGQLLRDQENRTKGIAAQIENRTAEIERLTAAPADPTRDARLADLQESVTDLQEMLRWSRDMEGFLRGRVERIDAAIEARDDTTLARLVGEVNDVLEAWFDADPAAAVGRDPQTGATVTLTPAQQLARAKAVTRIGTRHPQDSTGSWHTLLPQVSVVYARQQANGTLALSEIVNKALRADNDGDRMQFLHQIYLTDQEYEDLRSGANLLGASPMPEIASPKYEEWVGGELYTASTVAQQQVADLVMAVRNGIEADLRARYDSDGRRFVPGRVIDEVMEKVSDAIVTTSSSDLRSVVLQEMAHRAGPILTSLGRGQVPGFSQARFTNEFTWLARTVSQRLLEFQEGYAAITPLAGEPMADGVAAPQFTSDTQQRRGKRAATTAGTILEKLQTNSLFRAFQQLHYSVLNSTEQRARWANDWPELQELVLFYEQLNSNATGLASDDLPASDEITARVLRQLKALSMDPRAVPELRGAQNQFGSMALLANLRTAHWVYADRGDGTVAPQYTGETVTLAQQLLYVSAEQFRRDHAEVFSNDAQMQSTYASMVTLSRPRRQGLEGSNEGNAEAAFVRVFDSVPLYQILGDSAVALGVSRTVGQYYRQQLMAHPDQRRADKYSLRVDGEYLAKVGDAENPMTVPYSEQDIAAGRVTVFRSVADSIFSAADTEHSVYASGQKKGKPKPNTRMGTRDRRFSKQIADTHAAVRNVLQATLRSTEYTAQDVADLVEARPDLGRAMLATIPESVMPMVYRGQVDGSPVYAAWFFEAFATGSATEAEMILRRGIWLDSWQAMALDRSVDELTVEDGPAMGIEYHRLTSRMHRLMFRLATLPEGDQWYYREFLDKLGQATSLEAFMAWVNSQPGLVGQEAPLLGWIDDTAEFDATRAGSGWTGAASSTPNLLDNLANLQAVANRTISHLKDDKAREADDTAVATAIERYRRYLKGELADDETLHPEDEGLYRGFLAALDQAGKMDLTSGPRSMVLSTAISVFGIYGTAHAKGASPEHLAAVQALEALLGAFGYKVNFERLVGDLTAHDESAVAATPNLIVKDAGRTMDRFGSQVDWAEQTIDTVIPYLTDPSKRHLLRAMLYPQVMELDVNNVARRQLLVSGSLRSLLDSTTYKTMVPESGDPTRDQALRFLSDVEGQVRASTGQANAVQQRVTELALARTTAFTSAASFAEILDLANRSYLDFATALQAVGRNQDRPGEKDGVHAAYELVSETVRLQAVAAREGLQLSKFDLRNVDLIREALVAQLEVRYGSQIIALTDRADTSTDPAIEQQLRAQAAELEAWRDRDLQELDLLLTQDLPTRMVNIYGYLPDMSDLEKVAKREQLLNFVMSNGSLMQGAGEVTPVVQRIVNYHVETERYRALHPLELKDEEWQALSEVVISVQIQKALHDASSRSAPPPYPLVSAAEKNDAKRIQVLRKQRYFDSSFAYLVDFMSEDATDGLVEAARATMKKAGRLQGELNSDEVRDAVLRTIYRTDTLGTWTAAIPTQSIEAYDLLNGASSVPAIAMAGLLTRRWGAVAAATERTTEPVPAGSESTATLTWLDLDWRNRSGPGQQATKFHPVAVTHPGASGPVQRPFAQLDNRFARRLTMTYAGVGGTTTVDLTSNPLAAAEWNGVPAGSSDLRVVNMDRLRDEVESLLRVEAAGDDALLQRMLASLTIEMSFVHPDTQPGASPYDLAPTVERGRSFYNNVWYEGLVFGSHGDVSAGLIKSLFFGVEGINAVVQQAALDTRKKGLLGIEAYRRPGQRRVLEIEQQASTDFAQMLLDKTELVMTTPLGGGEPLHESFYNAVYKLMKLKHWVEGTTTVDGRDVRVRIPAEQVIEWQLRNGPGFPLRDATLWIPSDEVLASMMGDVGYGGVGGRLMVPDVPDFSLIPPFEGWSPLMDQYFAPAGSQPKTLDDTDVARVARIGDLEVRTGMDRQQESLFQRRRESIRLARQRTVEQRVRQQEHGFKPKKTVAKLRDYVQEAWASMDTSMVLPNRIGWASMPAGSPAGQARAALENYLTRHNTDTGGAAAGWIYRHLGPGNTSTGTLNKESLDGKLVLVPGDPVVLDVADFAQVRAAKGPEAARREALEVLGYFTSRNAAVMIVSSDGPDGLVAELTAALREQFGYERFQDSPRILVPNVINGLRSQNLEASRARLTESTGLSTARQRLSLLVLDRPVGENTMMVPVRTDRRSGFESIQTTVELLPLNVAAEFGVPQTREDLDRVRQHIAGLNNPEGRDMLRKRLRGKPGAATFDEAWDAMIARLDDSIENGNTTLPLPGTPFGTGDFIPLIGLNGELLLYRHGYKFPYRDFQQQLRGQTEDRDGHRGVAIYDGDMEPQATTHHATVVQITDRRKHGLQLELAIPVKALGSKQVFEYNGMKFVLTELPPSMSVPSAPVLQDTDGNVMHLEGVASLHDVLSKQANYGLVNDFQSAIAVFGFDFRPYIGAFLGLDVDDTLRVLRAVERAPNKLSVEELMRAQDAMVDGLGYRHLLGPVFESLAAENLPTQWAEQVGQETPEAAMTRAMLMYLMSEGANLDAVISSTGFLTEDRALPSARSQLMPELFTRAFDRSAFTSPVRLEMLRQFNRRLGTGPVVQAGPYAGKNSGWMLNAAWQLTGLAEDGSLMTGTLQFGEPHVSSDNAELNVQAQDRKMRQGSSVHLQLTTAFGVGGDTVVDKRTMAKLTRIEQGLGASKTPVVYEPGELWRTMTNVNPATTGAGARWQWLSPQENKRVADSLYRTRFYRQSIDISGPDFEEAGSEIRDIRQDIADMLGLSPAQVVIIDYWVRQLLWRPGKMPGQTEYVDSFFPTEILDALKHIQRNLREGLLPVQRGGGPSMMSETDLRMLFTQRKTGRTTWSPWRQSNDPNSALTTDDYGHWIALAFGQALNSSVKIDDAAVLDYDGFLNTYRDVLRELGYMLDVTLDKDLQGILIDPASNELAAVSISPTVRQLLKESWLLPNQQVGLDRLRPEPGGETPLFGTDPANAVQGHSRKRVAQWRRENKIRPTKRAAARDFVEHGTKVLESNADQHSLTRILIALRHSMAMLNPGLYISMLPEQGFRGLIAEGANALSGTSTGRMIGGATSRLGANQYGPETITALNRLYTDLGNDNAFSGSIIRELMYTQPPQLDSTGRIVRGAEGLARFAGKWQDPTWGMPQRSLGRTYVEALLRMTQERPLEFPFSVDTIIAQLSQNPLFFKEQYPDLHLLASNAVIDRRSLKQTPWSLAIRSIYEPLTRSSSATLNFAGTLLKLPLMYAPYYTNVLTTLTGMQGYTQLVATIADGRRTPGTLAHRMYLWTRGEQLTPDQDVRIDMSSALDGFTIANAFIRGGVTQTSLFMLGMLAGGVLGGEDEEAKRRRKLAEAQNVPFLADPRRLEADFRNKDMLFLDWLPSELATAFFRLTPEVDGQEARSGFQMSWILKPFLSPIIGMEKFFQTGDFGWVTYGFMDALGSLPLFNKDLWDDANRSAEELVALAGEQQQVGTPEATRNSMWLLTRVVGLYENMLLENMFVNSLYTGLDTYDRDPTKLALKDSSGVNQVTIQGTPRENDVALSQFVDPETGQVVSGYTTRDARGRALAYLTENRATLAAITSLFTGFQQGLGRYSMPVKMQEIDLGKISRKDAKAITANLMQRVWESEGGPPRMFTLQEITKTIKQEAIASGDWDTYNNLDAIAQREFEQQGGAGFDVLSVLDLDGNERLTNTGAAAVLKGIQKGNVGLTSPALQNISMSYEMRAKLQKEFLDDVTQEGVDMGMTNSQAVERAKRLLNGPTDDPSVKGFADVLWSDTIPYSNKRQYRQLNTTYVMGPDGFPWATGFTRGGFWNQLGLPKRPTLGMSGDNATDVDSRLNTTDLVAGINTGLRGLQPFDESQNIPTAREIGKEIERAIKDLENRTYDFTPYDKSNSSGRFYNGGFRRYGYSRSGYGSRGYSSGGGPMIYFSRQSYLPEGSNVYGDSVRNIFWDSPTIRRTTIRRERYQSSRGRLNQWQ